MHPTAAVLFRILVLFLVVSFHVDDAQARLIKKKTVVRTSPDDWEAGELYPYSIELSAGPDSLLPAVLHVRFSNLGGVRAYIVGLGVVDGASGESPSARCSPGSGTSASVTELYEDAATAFEIAGDHAILVPVSVPIAGQAEGAVVSVEFRAAIEFGGCATIGVEVYEESCP